MPPEQDSTISRSKCFFLVNFTMKKSERAGYLENMREDTWNAKTTKE